MKSTLGKFFSAFLLKTGSLIIIAILFIFASALITGSNTEAVDSYFNMKNTTAEFLQGASDKFNIPAVSEAFNFYEAFQHRNFFDPNNLYSEILKLLLTLLVFKAMWLAYGFSKNIIDEKLKLKTAIGSLICDIWVCFWLIRFGIISIVMLTEWLGRKLMATGLYALPIIIISAVLIGSYVCARFINKQKSGSLNKFINIAGPVLLDILMLVLIYCIVFVYSLTELNTTGAETGIIAASLILLVLAFSLLWTWRFSKFGKKTTK